MLSAWMMLSPALADVPGSQDHPIIERYPGSTIEWYLVENYRPYKVPLGPVSGYRELAMWAPSEGRLTRIYYALDGGARSDSEVYKNYRDALATAGFEILGEGHVAKGVRGGAIGSREWQDVIFRANPWGDKSGAINEMAHGTATSAGSGSIIARKVREAGTAFVVVSVYQLRDDRIGTLIDVLEVESAQSGLVTVNAEAIGAAITEQGRVVLEGLYFDFDKATLTAQSAPALSEIASYLKANAARTFYVVGHTDSKGTLAYNQKLSSDRAAAVVAALVKDHGIAAARLEAQGVGPLAPRSSNSADAGRERNRRVELVER
jgi:outer membrane protein OmpA-like peptidoglycan-associated protein